MEKTLKEIYAEICETAEQCDKEGKQHPEYKMIANYLYGLATDLQPHLDI